MRKLGPSALLQHITVQPGPRRAAPIERAASPAAAARPAELGAALASGDHAAPCPPPLSEPAIVRLFL